MAAEDIYGFDAGAPDPNAGGGGYTTQPYGSTYSAPPPPASGASGSFFDDPLMQYVEGILRQRIDAAGQPIDTSYLDPVRQALYGGGGGGGGGGEATGPSDPTSGNPDPLGSFRNFIGGFNPGDSGLGAYVKAQDPQQYQRELAAYGGTRDPFAASGQLQDLLAQLGPNTTISDLQTYMQGRDPNAGIDELRQFSQNFNPTGDYQTNLQSRIDELRGSPFNDTQLAARRVAAFDQMERDRQVRKETRAQELAASGIDQSSGLYAKAMADIDREFDTYRAGAQNNLVNQEFQMIEQRKAQADQLEANAANMQLQSGQIAAQMMGTIAQMQQQGLSMQDALMQNIAQLGITDRGQQMQMMSQIAQLTQQGYQMQDALQIAISQMGLQAQAQADQLRVALAQTGLQQAGLQLEGQGQLAGMDVAMRGQDMSLQGQLAQAGATSGAANLGALVSFAGLQNQIAQQQQAQGDQAVNFALALNNMAREGFGDLGNYGFGGYGG